MMAKPTSTPDRQRRRLLRSMIGAALASPVLTLSGCGGSTSRRVSFALPPAGAGEIYTLHHAGGQETIEPYARVGNDGAGALGPNHYIEALQLPTDQVQRLHVTAKRAGDSSGAGRLVLAFMSVPTAIVTQSASRIAQLRHGMGLPVAAANRFDRYGDLLTAIDTATTLVFHHPELMSMEPEAAAIVVAHIQAAVSFDALWQEIAYRPVGAAGPEAWCEMVPLTQDDGTPHRDDAGNLMYDYRPASDILTLAGEVALEVLTTIHDDSLLKGKLWTVSDGAPNRNAAAPVTAVQAGGAYRLAASLASNERHSGAYFSVRQGSDGPRTVVVSVDNWFARFGALSLEFEDAGGQPMALSEDQWKTAAPSGAFRQDIAGIDGLSLRALMNLRYHQGGARPTWRYLTVLAPNNNFLGVPTLPGSTEVRFVLPDEATGATVRLGTLGNDIFTTDTWNRQEIGAALSFTCNIAMPGLLLAFGAPSSSGTLIKRAATDPGFMSLLLEFGFALISDGVDGKSGLKLVKLMLKAADLACRLLLDKRFAKLLGYVTVEIVKQNAIGAVPFVGWAWRMAAMTITAATLAKTTCEVLSSSCSVKNRITLAMDLEVTVHPDLDNGNFPTGAYSVQGVLNTGSTFTCEPVTLPSKGASAPVVLRFVGVPSGGSGRITVSVTDSDGTLRGKAEVAYYEPTIDQLTALQKADDTFAEPVPTYIVARLADPAGGIANRRFADTPALLAALVQTLGEVDAESWRRQIAARLAQTGFEMKLPEGSSSSTLALECTLQEQLSPLTSKTIYQHQRVLEFKNGHYGWRGDVARPMAPLTCDDTDGALCQLGGITVAQRSGQVAYSWQSASSKLPLCGESLSGRQAWTVQNLSTREDPETALRRLSQGAQDACGLTEGAAVLYQLMGPSNGSGQNYLIEGRSDAIYVRRINNSSALSLDLSGYTTAVGTLSQLPTAMAWHPEGYLVAVHAQWHKIEVLTLNRDSVPDDEAPPAMLVSGRGVRAGLVRGPTCVAVTIDGRVLVLESDAMRIQAFDVRGMPVPCFTGAATFALRAHAKPMTYLDLGVDVTGHIFVLCRETGGTAAPELEIYAPDGKFVTASAGFTAGRMTVDLWRNIWSLNTESMLGRSGRIEPTVSEWRPVTR